MRLTATLLAVCCAIPAPALTSDIYIVAGYENAASVEPYMRAYLEALYEGKVRQVPELYFLELEKPLIQGWLAGGIDDLNMQDLIYEIDYVYDHAGAVRYAGYMALIGEKDVDLEMDQVDYNSAFIGALIYPPVPRTYYLPLAADATGPGADIIRAAPSSIAPFWGVMPIETPGTTTNNGMYMNESDFQFIAERAVIALQPFKPGDADGDDDIDDFDLIAMIVNYGQTGQFELHSKGDADFDGDVDDFDIIAAITGYTGSLSSTAIPEPSSLALLAFGAAIATCRRR